MAQVPLTQGPIPVVTAHRCGAAYEGRPGPRVDDDAAEMERLLELGVRGIITDRPHVLKEVLERRGQWFG